MISDFTGIEVFTVGVKPPKYVRQAMVVLQGRGYPVFLVGNCVRELLTDTRPQLWELCTAASPEQILELFPGAVVRRQTVTVTVDSHQLPVFSLAQALPEDSRTDMARFVGALTAELGKQDFTINAIAISYDGLIADPFGGVEDIRRQLIRCIGSPEERFAEQPQNMFRALLYSARLGFTVDLFTMGGIRTRSGLATMLPAEYVRDEVEKLLLSRAPETVFSLVELGLLSRYLAPGLPDPTLLRRLSRLPRKAQYRWAGLCRVLKLSGCIDLEERFLGALHLDHRTIRMAVDSGLMQESALPQTDLSRKRWLRTYGVETVRCALACRDAFTGSHESAELRRILKSGECFSLKHLAVSGDDLLALGLRGRALGEMLDFLLEYVMEFPDNNRRELLLSLAAGSEE